MTNEESNEYVRVHAASGMQIEMTQHGCFLLQSDTKETSGVLTHKQSDGIWFANLGSKNICVGSGYDFRLVPD